MKIIQIFSHNAVSARSTIGKEVVVIGKGIGFQKRKGDLVNLQLVSKIYSEDREYLSFISEEHYH